MKPGLLRAVLFSFLSAGLIWLPMVNDLASGTPIIDSTFRIWSSGLATLGIWCLIWLNWGLRAGIFRNTHKK